MLPPIEPLLTLPTNDSHKDAIMGRVRSSRDATSPAAGSLARGLGKKEPGEVSGEQEKGASVISGVLSLDR